MRQNWTIGCHVTLSSKEAHRIVYSSNRGFFGGVYTWNRWGVESTMHPKEAHIGLYRRKGAYIYIIYIVCIVI